MYACAKIVGLFRAIFRYLAARSSYADRLEFELVPFGRHPGARFLTVVLLGIGIIACIVTGLLFVAGFVSGELTVYVFGTSLVGGVFMTWRFWRENKGSVEIEPEMLIIKTGAGRDSYGWDSVESVRLTNFAQLEAFPIFRRVS